MIEELYINEKYIELSESSKVGMSFQSNNLNSLSSRNGNFSNEFKVPKTKNNQIALQFSSGLNSSSQIAYQKNTAQYFQNGIQIVQNGIAIISSFDGYYQIQITSGNVSVFDLMAERTLNDLDYSADEVAWDLFDVFISKNNTHGLIYPIIDYNGASITQRQIDVRRLMPAVWAFDLFDKIFDRIGYTYSGDFTGEDFGKLLIPLATDKAVSDFSIIIDSFPGNNVTINTSSLYQDVGVLFVKTFDANNNWQYGNYIGGSQGWRFVVDYTGVHRFVLSLPYTSTGTGDIDVYILLTNVDFVANPDYSEPDPNYTLVIISAHVSAGSSGTINIDHSFFAESGQLVLISTRRSRGNNTITFLGNTSSYLHVTRPQESGRVTFGQVFPISINLPSIKQVDFIKMICQIYCLSYQTNDFNKNVEFHSFKKISDNIPLAKDWSSKMDVKQSFSIEYTIGSYAQQNIFKYKTDESVNDGNLIYSGSINVDNKTLPISQVSVELPFAETIMTTKLNGLDIPYINKYDVINDNFGLQTEPRLLYLDKQTTLSGGNLRYIDGVSTPVDTNTNIPLCYFVLDGKTSLGWNNNLLENNYEELQSVLTNVKKVTGFFKLNAIDISELDFSIPIFLDVQAGSIQINGNFYLNKISNFVSGKLTQCELVRL